MWISGCNTTTMSALIQADIIWGKHLCKPGENRYILQKRETSSAGEQPVRNNPIDNNGKIYTFMTNLSPLQTYINRLCQIRRLRLRFFLQSQLFHTTQELMIRNEHSACLNHTTYNNKTINSLVFARSISRSWQ